MRMTVRSAVAVLSLVVLTVLGLGVGAASAQENNSYVGAEVESATLIRPAAAPAANSAAVSNSSLAFTGGDAMTLALVGTIAVVAGGSLLIVRRRSTI